WQQLLEAIKSVAPDPFWTTLIPIVTTLFAVFGGFALSQWNERAKHLRDEQAKRSAEIRQRRRELVDYVARWSYATDKPRVTDKEFAYAGLVSQKFGLLASLTGDSSDTQVSDSLTEFIDAWAGRVTAASGPTDEYG